MTNYSGISDERLAELIDVWESNAGACRSHDLDTGIADEYVAALRELQRRRSSASEEGACAFNDEERRALRAGAIELGETTYIGFSDRHQKKMRLYSKILRRLASSGREAPSEVGEAGEAGK